MTTATEAATSPPPHQCSRRHWFIALICVCLFSVGITFRWYKPDFHPGDFLQYGTNWTTKIYTTTSQSKVTRTNDTLTNAINQSTMALKEFPNHKVILLWTSFFGQRTWHEPVGNKLFHNHKCKYTDCIMSVDRSLQKVADIIMFHCRDEVNGWPIGRTSHQTYGVFCLESPAHSDFGVFGNKMNISATYRLDSDIPTPYLKATHWPNGSAEVQNPKYISRTPFAQRNKYIVWPVSNCRTRSGREHYARELNKYIPVDIVGGCGKIKCPRKTQRKCMETFSRTHRFYLAFENSFCKDYMSDKVANVMIFGDLIPVVLGGADYSKHLPEHSYINARDYKSPKHLADYLHFLAKNETEYEKYFWWKDLYSLNNNKRDFLFCGLCEMAHNATFKKQSVSLKNWWKRNTCESFNVVSKLINGGGPL